MTTKKMENLKSSLDRFIDRGIICNYFAEKDLKSSLDRFIGSLAMDIGSILHKFKIQFG